MPNKLLQRIWQNADRAHSFLDFGAGQGRDSLFMAQNGWRVVAVERSPDEIAEMKKTPDFNKLPIKIIQGRAEDFEIEPDRYSIIQLFNVLQFIEKPKALDLIQRVKNALHPGGYIIVSGFTVDEPSYQKRPDACYFQKGQLRDLFSDFDVDFYREAVIDDPGHPGKEEPHQHHVVRMIAHKVEK
ncbi:MAG: class I SAM-dependent methyltransferase [Patescibacteria group bacterium]